MGGFGCYTYGVMRVSSFVILTSLAFVLTGCSLQQRLDSTAAKVHKRFEDAKAWESLPVRTISWEQAVAMMNRNNAELINARNDIEQKERDELSIYTNMIPGLSYYGYFTKTIEDLSGQFSAKDVNSNVNVTFSLPTLTQVPYRVYANKAQTYGAVKAYEGKQRECISKLYHECRTRSVRLRMRALEDEQKDTPEEDRMLAARDRATDDAQHWLKMAALLGDYSARWQILPQSLPSVQWSRYESRMGRLDDLVVCQYVLRLEQARMSQYGIALRYLPTINTSLYSPSLFSSSGGTYQGSFLSGEDTRLNLSLSYSLDTHMDNWYSYKRSKDNYEKVCREVAVGVTDHKNKLQTLRSSVKEYFNWRSYMHKRIEYLENQPVDSADALIQRSKTLYEMRRELLNQELQSVESEAAVILEYGLLK